MSKQLVSKRKIKAIIRKNLFRLRLNTFFSKFLMISALALLLAVYAIVGNMEYQVTKQEEALENEPFCCVTLTPADQGQTVILNTITI